MSCIKHILIPIFFIPVFINGQNGLEFPVNYIEKIIEQAVSTEDDQSGIEDMVSELEDLYTKPINLNAATATELERLWILNDFQIKALLDYRRKMGQIATIYELNYIYGFSESTIELIAPFITIGSKQEKKVDSFKAITKSLNQEIVIRAGQNNVLDESFTGNNQKYYTRYKCSNGNHLNMGLVAEKDAGENFFRGANPKGFDFYSGYILYSGKGALNTILIGDYRIKAGQGLLIWPGFSPGKSSQIMSVQKRGQGIIGNTSADEYGYYRGSALTIRCKGFSASVFGSYKQIDAKYDTVQGKIVAIRTDGLHRTESENFNEKTAAEKLIGTKLNYSKQHLNFGVNCLYTKYSNPVLPSEKIYQYYNFSGQEYIGFSGDYKLLFPRIQLFGEYALANNSTAAINGVNLMPHPQFITSLIYRNYKKSYFSPYSNGLSENSSTTNEEGLYAGVEWKTDWKWSFYAYADIFTFPWLKFGIDGPSNGEEYLFEGVYIPQSEIRVSFRYKYQEKLKNFSETETSQLNFLENFRQENYRIHFQYIPTSKVSMSTRIDYSQSGFHNQQIKPGYLAYQDIAYTPSEKMQFNFRYAWFDIADYNSRIYAYESNVRYVYSMPSYYGKGFKTYIVYRYNLSKSISIWVRYSQTNYFEEEKKNKHDGVIQIIMRF